MQKGICRVLQHLGDGTKEASLTSTTASLGLDLGRAT